MIDIDEADSTTIKYILEKYVPECEVRVFGSRVTGTAKPYSDIDIAIVGKKKIRLEIKAQLKYAFEESDLPFRVDVLDWYTISDNFKRIIEEHYTVIQKFVGARSSRPKT